jgi:hypothetical protein
MSARPKVVQQKSAEQIEKESKDLATLEANKEAAQRRGGRSTALSPIGQGTMNGLKTLLGGGGQ